MGYELIGDVWVEHCADNEQAFADAYARKAEMERSDPKTWKPNEQGWVSVDPQIVRDRVESVFAAHRMPAEFMVVSCGDKFVQLAPRNPVSPIYRPNMPTRDEILLATGATHIKAGNGQLILDWFPKNGIDDE